MVNLKHYFKRKVEFLEFHDEENFSFKKNDPKFLIATAKSPGILLKNHLENLEISWNSTLPKS